MTKAARKPRAAEPAHRPRNAEATRAAILASARRAFAASGYDGAGVREIAAGAGVTAMLVNRYFGSKEKLFAEVVADTMADPVILTASTLAAPNIGETIAAALVAMTNANAPTLDGFHIMFHSAASPRAAALARAQIEKHHQRTMANALTGAHREERAALVMSLVAGFQVMRQMIGLTALRRADPAVLTGLLTPLIQQLVSN